jgi:hypothetical protein
MVIEEDVMNKHLQICGKVCEDKGYNKLSSQREKIKREVLKYFNGNGQDLGKISRLLDKFDVAIFHYLDTYVMNRGSRPLGWPDYHEDSIRAEMLYELYV